MYSDPKLYNESLEKKLYEDVSIEDMNKILSDNPTLLPKNFSLDKVKKETSEILN